MWGAGCFLFPGAACNIISQCRSECWAKPASFRSCKVQGPDHLDCLEAAAPLLLQEHADVELAIRQVSSPSLLLRHRARVQSVNDKGEDSGFSKENTNSGAAGPFLYFGTYCVCTCSLFFCSRFGTKSLPDGPPAYSKSQPTRPSQVRC